MNLLRHVHRVPRTRGRLTPLWLAFSLVVAGLAVEAKAQDTIAIRGGTIVPVTSDPIEDGIVLIREGKIVAMGKEVSVPTEAKVIDAKGKVILPGFVDPHTSDGMSQVNEVNPVVPYVSVVDAIDPSTEFFEDSRRNGVTSAAIVPGNNTMIGGQAAVVKTDGTYVNDMLLKRDLGLKLSMRPASGRSRMAHLVALRKELEDAKQRLEEASKPKEADAAKDDEKKDEPKEEKEDEEPANEEESEESDSEGDDSKEADPLRAAMLKLVKGELPAFVYCDAAMDVPQALKLIDEYKLKAILVLGPDCYKAAELVAKSKLPVILDPTLVFWETDPRTDEDKQIVLPKVYREAGVPFVFQTAMSQGRFGGRAGTLTMGETYFWYQAATAVKHGMPAKEALEALTIRPAKILGIEGMVGSLEEGKDGDVVIWTADPLKANAWVDTTIIGGKVVYERDKDRKLKDLLVKPDEKAAESQ